MLQILLLEDHIDTTKRGGKGYYTGDIAQPLLVREIRHYEKTKVAQVHCTQAGFKFLLRKVPSSGPFTLALPDCAILLEAQARLLSVELSCFWFSYHKLKRGTEGDILRMKLQNFLKILQE